MAVDRDVDDAFASLMGAPRMDPYTEAVVRFLKAKADLFSVVTGIVGAFAALFFVVAFAAAIPLLISLYDRI